MQSSENYINTETPQNCLMKGECEDEKRNCATCGFNKTEAARRKALKWSINENGLRYKFIGKAEVEEPTQAHWETAGEVSICSSCGFQTMFPGSQCQKCGAMNEPQK